MPEYVTNLTGWVKAWCKKESEIAPVKTRIFSFQWLVSNVVHSLYVCIGDSLCCKHVRTGLSLTPRPVCSIPQFCLFVLAATSVYWLTRLLFFLSPACIVLICRDRHGAVHPSTVGHACQNWVGIEGQLLYMRIRLCNQNAGG